MFIDSQGIIIGNLGDCRAVLKEREVVTQISTDNKPEEKREFRRLSESGADIF